MIFVTIGTQEPFDRLIKAMDEISSTLNGMEVIAQVSNSSYKAQYMRSVSFITPVEFNKLFSEAKLVVSHAGMGTIISALQMEKPIIVMPRIAKFGEHRNEHQLATAKKMEALKYIEIAYTEEELKNKVNAFISKPDLKTKHKLGEFASLELISSLRKYIAE